MSTNAVTPRSALSWWPASGLVLLIVAATLVTRADADLWGHVRFGLDILETWRLPSEDPYSFTQDKPWVNHEWLSELVMGAAFAAAGPVGLVLLKGGLLTATLSVLWTAYRRARLSVQLLALLSLAAGSLQMTSPLRPQLWTFLGLAVLVRLLDGENRSHRWWLPLVFAVWANAHGGWVVGSGVLVLWAAGESWGQPLARRQWLWLLPMCAASTLLNPYGTGLWEFVATTVRPERNIEEWMPLWAANPWNWLGWGLGLTYGVLIIGYSTKNRVSQGLVLATLAYGGLTVLRIGPLFLLAALILAGPILAGRGRARSSSHEPGRSRGGQALAGLLLAAVPAVVAVRLGLFAVACIPPLPRASADAEPVRALAATTGEGRLVTYFDWGEYAIWHLGPRLKVSMDGRRETVYSDARLAEHDRILAGTPDGLDVLAGWNAEYVWLPGTSATTRDWLTSNGYRIDVETERSFLAVRADLPQLPGGHRAGPDRRCFPD